jgi:hypothetical protein
MTSLLAVLFEKLESREMLVSISRNKPSSQLRYNNAPQVIELPPLYRREKGPRSHFMGNVCQGLVVPNSSAQKQT